MDLLDLPVSKKEVEKKQINKEKEGKSEMASSKLNYFKEIEYKIKSGKKQESITHQPEKRRLGYDVDEV